MKTNFKTPVTMKVTNEVDYRKLRSELIALGYKYMDINSFQENMDEGYFYISSALTTYRSISKIGFTSRPSDHCVLLEEFNMEAFLAIAAMTEGDDWIIGEYLIYTNSHGLDNIFQVKSLDNGSNFKEGYADQTCRDYRKATLVDIQEHFSLSIKKEDEIKSRFPFALQISDSRRIIGAACGTWKERLLDKWSKDLTLNNKVIIDESFYKTMREACTSQQNSLFDDIFGKDISEPLFKVNQVVRIITGGYDATGSNGKIGFITNECITRGRDDGFPRVRILDEVWGMCNGFELETLN